MKLAAVPRLIEITLLHERAVRPNDSSPADAQELGDTPPGRRRIIRIAGGSFRGERLSGRVLPGGAGKW